MVEYTVAHLAQWALVGCTWIAVQSGKRALVWLAGSLLAAVTAYMWLFPYFTRGN